MTAVTAHAEILQVKKEWQMCIVEWFWSLGKATWMEMGLSLDRKWCDYSFLFKFESSMKCFYIRRFFYSTWLSFHLSLDFFFKGPGSDCISRAHQTPALANMVLDLVENHPHHQPWYHHCDCASDLIRSTEFMRAVWCEYAILPRISCNLCIYAAAIQNDEHGD